MSKATKAKITAWLLVAAITYPAFAASQTEQQVEVPVVHTAESSSMALSEDFGGTPVGKVPPENSASPEAIQEALEVSDADMEEALQEAVFPGEGSDDPDPFPVDMDDTMLAKEEPVLVEEESGWFSAVKNWLSSNVTASKARAKHTWNKRRLEMKYGKGSGDEPNYSILMNSEQEMLKADEVRRQRELALEVERQNKLKLYNESLMCLALNGYYEARGETADQEVASGAVVLNRLSVGFRGATTICEVVHSPKQFSWVESHGTAVPDFENSAERQAWERSVLIAKRLLDPDATYIDPTNGAVYYYNPSIVDWKYAPYYVETAVLGNHRFMREKRGHKDYIDNSNIRINPVLFNGLSHEEREELKKDYETNRSE